jgi:hypothetical protein
MGVTVRVHHGMAGWAVRSDSGQLYASFAPDRKDEAEIYAAALVHVPGTGVMRLRGTFVDPDEDPGPSFEVLAATWHGRLADVTRDIDVMRAQMRDVVSGRKVWL